MDKIKRNPFLSAVGYYVSMLISMNICSIIIIGQIDVIISIGLSIIFLIFCLFYFRDEFHYIKKLIFEELNLSKFDHRLISVFLKGYSEISSNLNTYDNKFYFIKFFTDLYLDLKLFCIFYERGVNRQ